MSAPLILPDGRTLDLGNPLTMLKSFAEIADVVGDDYDEYGELFGVSDAVLEENDEIEPDWYEKVATQAKEVLDTYGDDLGPDATTLLETLS